MSGEEGQNNLENNNNQPPINSLPPRTLRNDNNRRRPRRESGAPRVTPTARHIPGGRMETFFRVLPRLATNRSLNIRDRVSRDRSFRNRSAFPPIVLGNNLSSVRRNERFMVSRNANVTLNGINNSSSARGTPFLPPLTPIRPSATSRPSSRPIPGPAPIRNQQLLSNDTNNRFHAIETRISRLLEQSVDGELSGDLLEQYRLELRRQSRLIGEAIERDRERIHRPTFHQI